VRVSFPREWTVSDGFYVEARERQGVRLIDEAQGVSIECRGIALLEFSDALGYVGESEDLTMIVKNGV
jgi:hypothetical protein